LATFTKRKRMRSPAATSSRSSVRPFTVTTFPSAVVGEVVTGVELPGRSRHDRTAAVVEHQRTSREYGRGSRSSTTSVAKRPRSICSLERR